MLGHHGKSCGYCAPAMRKRRSGRCRAGQSSKFGSRDAVGTKGGDDGHVGVANFAARPRLDAFPIRIEHEKSAQQLVHITRVSIVGNVALEEYDPASLALERLAKASPEGGVAVAPGRTDGEAEHDDFHVANIIASASTYSEISSRSPSNLSVVHEPGSISTRANSPSDIPR